MSQLFLWLSCTFFCFYDRNLVGWHSKNLSCEVEKSEKKLRNNDETDVHVLVLSCEKLYVLETVSEHVVPKY